MARIITNYLKAHGEPPDVQRFFADISGKDAAGNAVIMDLSAIAPAPETMSVELDKESERALIAYANAQQRPADFMRVLGDMGDYGAVFLPKQKAAFWENGGRDVTSDDPESLALGEKLYANAREYGAPTLGEWNKRHHNAVWPAYNQERADDGTVVFDTPKNGVPELIQTLSAQHPAVTLSYCHADEDRGKNAAQYEFAGGGCTFMNLPADDTPEANRIAAAVFGDYENEAERAELSAEELDRIMGEFFDDEADEQYRDDEDYYGEQDGDEDDYEYD